MATSPTVTLTGTIYDVSGNPSAGTVSIQLDNYGDAPPTVSRSAIFAPTSITVQAAADGTFSTTLYGNHQITPYYTTYIISVCAANSSARTSYGTYQFTVDGVYDLASLTPVSTPTGGVVNYAPNYAIGTATTPSTGDNSNSIATTQFVQRTLASPPAIGSTTPAAGTFTTVLSTTTNGTANASRYASLATAAAAADTIDLPAGTYSISALTLATAKHLRGAGKKLTRIQVPAGVTGLQFTSAAPGFGSIRDLTIELQGDGSIGIDALGMNRWDITNVDFVKTGGTTGQVGIWFHGGNQYSSYYNNLIGCQFAALAGTAVRCTDSANEINIIGCRFNSCQIEIEVDGGTMSADGVTPSTINTVWVNNCNIEGTTGTGISIGNGTTAGSIAYDTTVENCRFEGARTPISIGAKAQSTRLLNNWYSGGSVSDNGFRTSRFDARSFGGGINSQFNWVTRQNIVVQPNDIGLTLIRVIASASGSAFVPSAAYPNISAYVVPTVTNGHIYKVTTAGVATTEPAWPTGSGATISSGTVTFTEAGLLSQNARYVLADATAGDIGSLNMSGSGSAYGLLDNAGSTYRFGAFTGTNGKCQVTPNGTGTFDVCSTGGSGGTRFMDGSTSAVVASVSSTGLGTFNGGVTSTAVGTFGSVVVGSGTAITKVVVYTPTLTPGSVAPNTTAEQTFTVTGLTTADKVVINGPAPTAGTGIVSMRVSAADTLKITFSNNTAGALTPASGVYNIVAFRS